MYGSLDFVRAVAQVPVARVHGTVTGIKDGAVRVAGLGGRCRIGDMLMLGDTPGEVVAASREAVTVMPHGAPDGLRVGDRAEMGAAPRFRPCAGWLGRVVDAFGQPLDGRPLPQGGAEAPLRPTPPDAATRARLGARLGTGLAAFDAMLPLVEGQRMGLFAGSGVGKSRLLARLARGIEADAVVVGLIGERGREVRELVEDGIGPEAMARCCVVAATSDRPAPVRRRAAWAAMAVAEALRDDGARVLLLMDSVTRFAEAHREVALTAGEAPSLRGFPPSMVPMLASLAERAGPGTPGTGSITALMTVLVAGSDMEEPVADTLRGMLDGHVVLDRAIAERGRFPAIDVLRSVSRSLPDAASDDENALIAKARALLGLHRSVAPMLEVGLYRAGTEPATDEAVRVWPALDAWLAEGSASPANAFARLAAILGAQPEASNEAEAAGPKPEERIESTAKPGVEASGPLAAASSSR